MSSFGGGSSSRYSHATIDKIRKNLHILQQNQNYKADKI